MKIDYKYEAKAWAVFFITVLLSFFIHELGHCTVAWLYGLKAVPTPAKEYLLTDAPPGVDKFIALGGISGTVLFTIAASWYFIVSKWRLKAAVLAASITAPGVYVLMFLLKGRGHDDTEFQDAQSALGLSYSGHFIDWLSLALFVAGVLVWLVLAKPSLRIIPKLMIGVVLAFIFTAGVQTINNIIFDPLFAKQQESK